MSAKLIKIGCLLWNIVLWGGNAFGKTEWP